MNNLPNNFTFTPLSFFLYYYTRKINSTITYSFFCQMEKIIRNNEVPNDFSPNILPVISYFFN